MSIVNSMTGYSSVESDGFSVSIKSVNSRYLDLNIKFSGDVEQAASKLIKKSISRGRVEVNLNSVDAISSEFSKETFDKLISDVSPELSKLGLALNEEIVASLFRASLVKTSGSLDVKKVLPVIEQAVELLKSDRRREGAALVDVLNGYLSELVAMHKTLSNLAKGLPEIIKERVAEKLKLLSTDERAASELAYLLEKSDFAEELVRLGIHLSDVESTITGGGVVGRKLDFLSQELGREINTIGSKSSSSEISTEVINFKSTLEKFREQVQNIE